MNNYIIFNLDGFSYGIKLEHVEKITYSVAVTPLPAAPPSLLGVINFQGDYIPVLNIRKKCGVPFKPVGLSDKLLIIKNSKTRFAITVDSLGETFPVQDGQIVPPDSIWAGLTYLKGIYRKNEMTVLLIDDLEIFRDDDREFINNEINTAGQNE